MKYQKFTTEVYLNYDAFMKADIIADLLEFNWDDRSEDFEIEAFATGYIVPYSPETRHQPSEGGHLDGFGIYVKVNGKEVDIDELIEETHLAILEENVTDLALDSME